MQAGDYGILTTTTSGERVVVPVTPLADAGQIGVLAETSDGRLVACRVCPPAQNEYALLASTTDARLVAVTECGSDAGLGCCCGVSDPYQGWTRFSCACPNRLLAYIADFPDRPPQFWQCVGAWLSDDLDHFDNLLLTPGDDVAGCDGVGNLNDSFWQDGPNDYLQTGVLWLLDASSSGAHQPIYDLLIEWDVGDPYHIAWQGCLFVQPILRNDGIGAAPNYGFRVQTDSFNETHYDANLDRALAVELRLSFCRNDYVYPGTGSPRIGEMCYPEQGYSEWGIFELRIEVRIWDNYAASGGSFSGGCVTPFHSPALTPTHLIIITRNNSTYSPIYDLPISEVFGDSDEHTLTLNLTPWRPTLRQALDSDCTQSCVEFRDY